MRKRLLGEYLVDRQLITPDQLQRALELQILQAPVSPAQVGTVLVQLGLIKEQDIASALEHQQLDQGPLRRK